MEGEKKVVASAEDVVGKGCEAVRSALYRTGRYKVSNSWWVIDRGTVRTK